MTRHFLKWLCSTIVPISSGKHRFSSFDPSNAFLFSVGKLHESCFTSQAITAAGYVFKLTLKLFENGLTFSGKKMKPVDKRTPLEEAGLCESCQITKSCQNCNSGKNLVILCENCEKSKTCVQCEGDQNCSVICQNCRTTSITNNITNNITSNNCQFNEAEGNLL